MKISNRIILALAALTYCVWASATQVRHFAGTPSGAMNWLWVAPAIGCLITAIGLAWERGQAVGTRGAMARMGAGGVAGGRELDPWLEVPSWRRVEWGARWMQYGGFALLTWRSLWMFFSWDGMFLFPAWILLSLALYRWHPRWVPCS